MIHTKTFFFFSKGDYYFVHSYEMVCNKSSDIVATVKYGKEIVASVGKENILGTVSS